MIKAVIFDLDGTLITLEERFFIVLNDAFKKYTKRNLDRKELIAHFISDITVSNFLIDSGLPKEKLDACWQEFLLLYRKQKYWKLSKVIIGVTNVLKDLKNKGLKLALITGGITDNESLEKELNYFGIKIFFDFTLPASTYKKSSEWKKTEQIKKAVEFLSIKLEESVFAGDYIADIKAARELGIKFISVGKRKSPEFPADLYIDDFSKGLNLELLK